MIVTACQAMRLDLSPMCSLYIPKQSIRGSLCLPMPFLEGPGDSLQEIPVLKKASDAYVVVSHATGRWSNEEIELLSLVLKKEMKLVLYAGSLEQNVGAFQQKELVSQLRHLEELFLQSCSLFLSTKSISWNSAAPFVLQLLMQLEKSSSLFFDPGLSLLPSSLMADIAWGLEQHALALSSDVSFVPIFRQRAVPYKSLLVEIPFFQELEKIQHEMGRHGFLRLAFLEQEGVEPLCFFLQKQFFTEACLRSLSLRSFLRMTLRQKLHCSLSHISELEESMREVEKIFHAHDGSIPEGSSFFTLIEAIGVKLRAS